MFLLNLTQNETSGFGIYCLLFYVTFVV